MSYTKRQLLSGAFDELGLADYIYDLAADQLEMALRRLDSMMAQWNALGLRVGYPLPASPQNSDIDAETDVPDSALEAILLNLAIHLAPSYGKVISQDTRTNAKAAFVVALNRAAMPDEQRIGAGLPMGAGNKRLGTFTTETTDEIIEAPEDALSFS